MHGDHRERVRACSESAFYSAYLAMLPIPANKASKLARLLGEAAALEAEAADESASTGRLSTTG